MLARWCCCELGVCAGCLLLCFFCFIYYLAVLIDAAAFEWVPGRIL